MKSGKLAHVIEIQRSTKTVNDAGTQVEAWEKHLILRAEVLEQEAEEFLRNAGNTSVERIVLKTRFVNDLWENDRVMFREAAYDIEKINRLGRRHGYEIHCQRVTP